jgi:cytidine deaminase
VADRDSVVELVDRARRARGFAIATYSGFAVGAAFRLADGGIVDGANIENASYGLTMCAERVALFKALSEGYRDFLALAVVADTSTLTPPCGPCRQLLWEFCGDVRLVLANLDGLTAEHRLADLLPLPFDGRLLP